MAFLSRQLAFGRLTGSGLEVDAWCRVARVGFAPQLLGEGLQRGEKSGKIKGVKIWRETSQLLHAGFEQASGADEIAPPQMVERDGDLNQALEHCPLVARGFHPGFFQSFVGLEKAALVVKGNSARQQSYLLF